MDGAKSFFEEYKITKKRDDFIFRLGTLFIASLGLVTALAWEDAARSTFTEIFGPLDNIADKLLYAIIITALAVIISISIGKIANKREK
jgi:NADH:ubiquinone oxidoreductase subunit H